MNRPFLYLVLAIGFWATSCEQKAIEVANERTIIVYINADNNLYDRVIGSNRYGALNDLNEMELGWHDDDYRHTTLLAYINSGTKGDVPRIYRIRHDEDMKVIRSEVVHRYEAHDASDHKVLSQVLNDAMMIAPAKSYGLVLWSHGTGWVPMNMGQPLKSAGRGEDIANYTFGSSDAYKNSQMEIIDLVKALPANVVFDYIAFDACYMGGIEVAYELRNNCRWFISSSIETPIDGFPYHKIMRELISADTEGIVQKNYDYYSKLSGWWATMAMSTIDCSKLDALAAATKQLTTNSPKTLSTLSTANVQDLSSTPTFRGTYYDLNDYVVRNWASAADLDAFKAALSASVKFKLHLPLNLGNYNITTYSGYSCYAPKASQPKALAAYRTKFAWSKASGMGAIE